MSRQNVSAVEVGDRVRATCGESVIVGEVAAVTNGLVLYVIVDGDDTRDRSRCFAFADWIVEVLAPPIPDVVGTIVRDSQGDAWQRANVSWQCAGSSQRFTPTELQENYGPLTVLWTPEATP